MAHATTRSRPSAVSADRVGRSLAVVLALLMAWGIVSVSVAPPAAAIKVTAGEAAAYYARNYLVGVTYALGGRAENRFDCSGSAYLAWKHALPGVVQPGSSASQYSTPGTRIDVGRGATLRASDLKPGDLLFWSDSGKARDIDHVAVYLGSGQILQTAEGRRSWIGGLNDNKATRMASAIRPEGSSQAVSSVAYDAMKAGLTDVFEYGDFNGDGYDDVLWFTGTMSADAKRTGVQLAYGGPSGFGSFRRALAQPLSPVDQDFAVGDFNGDGRDDLLWFTGLQWSDELMWTGWQVAYGTDGGLSELVLVKQTAMTPSLQHLQVGDFDGDGADDVLWMTGTTSESARWSGWHLASGTEYGMTRFTRVADSAVSPSVQQLAFGDFDGDGADDVLWFTGTKDLSATYSGWQLASGGSDGFADFSKVSRSSTSPKTKRFAYGDFNGDGTTDVLWFTGTTSATKRWNGWQLASGTPEGMTGFSQVRRDALSPWTHPLAFGDFNGDGTDDVLWFTGSRNSSKKYWGWRLTTGRPSGFSSLVQVSRSGYTPYRQ